MGMGGWSRGTRRGTKGIKAALRQGKKAPEPTPTERLLYRAEMERLRWASAGQEVRGDERGGGGRAQGVVRWQDLFADWIVKALRRCMHRAREITEPCSSTSLADAGIKMRRHGQHFSTKMRRRDQQSAVMMHHLQQPKMQRSDVLQSRNAVGQNNGRRWF